MSESRWSQSNLSELVTPATLAKQMRLRDTDAIVFNLWVIVPPPHGFHVPYDLKSRTIGWDDERTVSCLRDIRIRVCSRDHNGEIGALSSRGKPFVSVNDPLIAIFNGRRLNQCGI